MRRRPRVGENRAYAERIFSIGNSAGSGMPPANETTSGRSEKFEQLANFRGAHARYATGEPVAPVDRGLWGEHYRVTSASGLGNSTMSGLAPHMQNASAVNGNWRGTYAASSSMIITPDEYS